MSVDIARKTALDILLSVEKEKSYSNIALAKAFEERDLSNRDKAFISALVYGTLDRQISLDYIISKYIRTAISKIKPITRTALRIAVFQIKYMDKIPESAAVNESVNIVKASKERFNASFVNGVLRAYLRNPVDLPCGNDVKSLKFRFSCPEWIIESFINDYGFETAVKLLEESLKKPPVTLKTNTFLTDSDSLLKILNNEGISAEMGSVDGSITVNSAFDIKFSKAYKDGLFYAEDLASQTVISKIGIKKGDRILDTCAAPGGKSFGMAMLCGDGGSVTALELYEHRAELIKKSAKRLKISNIKVLTGNATENNPDLGKFDVVLCDVPCSGLGVIRRKPEIKYKDVSGKEMENLVETQSKILECSTSYLKKNGTFVYSTCTLNNSENRGQITAFLDKHPDYELKCMGELMPHKDGTDGFFYCILKSR